MKLDDKTLKLIDHLLTLNEALVTTLYFDYNELDTATREKKWREHYTASKVLKEITGVEAYHKRCREESEQQRRKDIEESKVDIDFFTSSIKEELINIKEPKHFRVQTINKDGTTDINIEYEHNSPPIETPVYPDATKDEWLISLEHAKKHFNLLYKQQKDFYENPPESFKVEITSSVKPDWYKEPILQEIFIDEDIINLISGYMLGPVGMFRNKAIQTGVTQKYDSIDEMRVFLKMQSKRQDIVIYMTYKQGSNYYFRGAFVDKN